MDTRNYVKKPTPITAIQFKKSNLFDCFKFCNKITLDKKDLKYYIDTPDGLKQIEYGDYIIKEISGEYYPCNQNIFLKSYSGI